jgi:hypothetical protein
MISRHRIKVSVKSLINAYHLSLIQTVNDRVVVSRSCAYEDINQSADTCMRQQTPSYIRTEFCETCGHDGCNSATKFTAATLLALIPALIAFVVAL